MKTFIEILKFLTMVLLLTISIPFHMIGFLYGLIMFSIHNGRDVYDACIDWMTKDGDVIEKKIVKPK